MVHNPGPVGSGRDGSDARPEGITLAVCRLHQNRAGRRSPATGGRGVIGRDRGYQEVEQRSGGCV